MFVVLLTIYNLWKNRNKYILLLHLQTVFMWKNCHETDHQRLPNCCNCKIEGDCTGLDGHWQHCLLYNCEAHSFRDNLSEIIGKLTKKTKRYQQYLLHMKQIFYSASLLLGFWSARQGKIRSILWSFKSSLPGLLICRCTWEVYWKQKSRMS